MKITNEYVMSEELYEEGYVEYKFRRQIPNLIGLVSILTIQIVVILVLLISSWLMGRYEPDWRPYATLLGLIPIDLSYWIALIRRKPWIWSYMRRSTIRDAFLTMGVNRRPFKVAVTATVEEDSVSVSMPGLSKTFPTRKKIYWVKETEHLLIVGFRGRRHYVAFKKDCFDKSDHERMKAYFQAVIQERKQFPRTITKLEDYVTPQTSGE